MIDIDDTVHLSYECIVNRLFRHVYAAPVTDSQRLRNVLIGQQDNGTEWWSRTDALPEDLLAVLFLPRFAVVTLVEQDVERSIDRTRHEDGAT